MYSFFRRESLYNVKGIFRRSETSCDIVAIELLNEIGSFHGGVTRHIVLPRCSTVNMHFRYLPEPGRKLAETTSRKRKDDPRLVEEELRGAQISRFNHAHRPHTTCARGLSQ